MSNKRSLIGRSRRLVVKIGSALLTNDGRGLDKERIALWVDQIAWLYAQKVEIVLVSSGSVAEGMVRLGMRHRPGNLPELQAAAAVGQMGLVRTYESAFQRHHIKTAQVLLTHDDLSDRKRYLNGRSTLRTLMGLGVVPIVNENDTVVTDEICFGDNDTLGALVANLIEADGLIILTDQDGLCDKDPRKFKDAKLLHQVMAADKSLDAMASEGGALGRGGMVTKIRAARLAARSGAFTVIAGGRIPDVLIRLYKQENLGTLLLPSQGRQAARKQWLAGHLRTKGTLTLDDGAAKVLQQQGKSLLPIGVVKVTGNFKRGDMVVCEDLKGRELARGLVNYDMEDAIKLLGQPSSSIESLIGFTHGPELVHRDNLVLT